MPRDHLPETGTKEREMKKQALKAVTMLISIIALAFMTAVATSAQSRGHSLKADIPFDFAVGDKMLPAGEYTVGKASTQDDSVISIRSNEGSQSAVRLTNNVQANAPKKRALLIFNRYGNTYFLAQIWTAGSTEGREMLKSKAERAAESELAKIHSGSDLAKNVETVTVVAEIQ
ncbi:MAG TPA: hypothetical protein VF791_04900 [Pyrinomonadaceae bacterium]